MVNRYDFHHCVDDGDYVLYNDYAALEARVADLEMGLGDTESDFNAAVQHNMELQAQIAELEKGAARRLQLIRDVIAESEWRHGARNLYAELLKESMAARNEA